MNNVIQLFGRKNIAPSRSKSGVATAVTNVLVSSAQLDYAVKRLSTLFDAIEHTVDGVGDTDIRRPLKHTTKLSRDALSDALLKLSQDIQKLLEAANAGTLKGRRTITIAPKGLPKREAKVDHVPSPPKRPDRRMAIHPIAEREIE